MEAIKHLAILILYQNEPHYTMHLPIYVINLMNGKKEKIFQIAFCFEHYNNTHNNQLVIDVIKSSTHAKYFIRFHALSDSTRASEFLNELLNQPKDYFPSAALGLFYKNVWDRSTALNFHASFVPFDNYQYRGTIFDKWQTPIIYQDPNTSSLFNIWITSDLKTPLSLLYEEFIFRFTFIISSADHYD